MRHWPPLRCLLDRPQVLGRGAVEEALLHAAERAVQRQRRGDAPGPARVLPGAHVQQQAARRQAEPAAGEAEGLPVLVLTRLRRRAVLYCVVSCYSPQAWAPPVPSTAGACARPDKAKAWSVVLCYQLWQSPSLRSPLPIPSTAGACDPRVVSPSLRLGNLSRYIKLWRNRHLLSIKTKQ